MTSLSGETISLAKVTNLIAFFLKSPVPGTCIRDIGARSAYTRSIFFGGVCTRAFSIRGTSIASFCTIGACTKSACLRGISTRDTYAGGTCVRGACIEAICIKGTCITGFCARGLWVGDTCTYADSACISAWVACGMGIFIENTCVNSFSAVECSGMHLQFFQNLEIGGAGLEILVGAGYSCIKSAYFHWNIEVRRTGLEIRLRAGYACIKIVCFKDAGTDGTSTADTCVRRVYIRGFCIGSTYTKDAGTKGVSTESTLVINACTKGTYSGDTYIEAGTCFCNTCIRASSIGGTGRTFFKGAGIEDTCIRVVCCTSNSCLCLRVLLNKLW